MSLLHINYSITSTHEFLQILKIVKLNQCILVSLDVKKYLQMSLSTKQLTLNSTLCIKKIPFYPHPSNQIILKNYLMPAQLESLSTTIIEISTPKLIVLICEILSALCFFSYCMSHVERKIF